MYPSSEFSVAAKKGGRSKKPEGVYTRSVREKPRVFPAQYRGGASALVINPAIESFAARKPREG